ncbi:MAG: DUF1064 domain-containing protein [Cetobacterium sp.]
MVLSKNKYNNKKVVIDDITFDSKAEARFYLNIKGSGLDYELQPKFLLQEAFKKNGKTYRKIEYIADFKIGNRIIDIKGVETEAFKIKRKIFEYKYQDFRLECLKECPKRFSQHATFGFIELDLYKKLLRK